MTDQAQDVPPEQKCGFEWEGEQTCKEHVHGSSGFCFLHDATLQPEQREQAARDKGYASLKTYLEDKVKHRADLTGANLEGAKLFSANLEGAKLFSANLEGANLSDANLEGAHLWRANLEGADLSHANLEGAKLWDVNLQGARLWRANLEGADLSDANLKGADLSDANLEGAYLSRANLKGADLSDANLKGAGLPVANLEGAYLSRANLKGAKLWDANLKGADLSDANLEGASLSGAHLEGADLSHVNLREVRGVTAAQFKDIKPEVTAFRALKRALADLGQYDDASLAAFWEKQQQKKDLSREVVECWAALWKKRLLGDWARPLRMTFAWLLSSFLETLCGYFEKPGRPLRWSAVVVLSFALFYHWTGAITPYPIPEPSAGQEVVAEPHEEIAPANMTLPARRAGPAAKRPSELSECVYFSVVTFTTLGYGDFRPEPECRALAALEAAIGALLIAIFVVTLSHRYVAR